MPEGDTIHRLARRLDEALAGRVVRRARADAPGLVGVELEGRRIARVTAHGKHLLIAFEGGGWLHTHQRMRGRWIVARDGRDPTGGRRVEVALFVDGVVAYCVNAPLVEWVTDLRRARWLGERLRADGTLPPDLLADDFPERLDEALARLRRDPPLPLGEALLDQSRVAGIGNEYKSELLFMARLDPFAPVSEVSDDALRALLGEARRWMRRNVARGGPRRTRLGEGPAQWVYRRAGERCLVCDGRVRRVGDERGGRSTYLCPSCQVSREKG